MASKYEKLVEDMKQEMETSPAETSPAETTTPTETPPQEDAPPSETNPTEDTPPSETPPQETAPTPPADDRRKPSEYSPQERAEHAFKRQLAKQKEKHDAEMKELKESFQKQIDELKKQNSPKPEVKTRDDFPDDDSYIQYLAKLEVGKILAERDSKAAEEASNKQKADDEARKQQEELAEQQRSWLSNVDTAFGGDEQRKTTFLKRVQFCNERGLGEILDHCPVAADFLMNNPRGPIVFEKILNDREAFTRVFNERNPNPLDIYYELRALDKELASAPQETQQTQQTQQTQPAGNIPHLGKPGKQAGGNSAPDIFSDPKAMKDWLRTH